MASTLDFVEYLESCLAGLGFIRHLKMFGEYMVYFNDKPLILVADNVAYVKIIPALELILDGCEKGYPYNGAKEHYILDFENRHLCQEVLKILDDQTTLKIKKKGKLIK